MTGAAMKLRRSVILGCKMPFRLRRHAPHEVALGGGIAVAVVFVRLPQREFEPFILGGQVGAKVEMIAEEHLVGVPCNPGRR